MLPVHLVMNTDCALPTTVLRSVAPLLLGWICALLERLA